MDLDDVFNQLTSKRVTQEMSELQDADGVARQIPLVNKLLESLCPQFGEIDLERWQRSSRDTPEVSPELVAVLAFVKGVHLPLMDEVASLRSERLGELGICLHVGPQLFALNSQADGVLYLKHTPPAGIDIRVYAVLQAVLKTAHEWAGCTREQAEDGGDGKTFTFDGAWVGGDPKTVLEHMVRTVFAGTTLKYDDAACFEKLEFEISMRKAFGKGDKDDGNDQYAQ